MCSSDPKRVPTPLRNYQGLCEVGSTLGQVIEIDMETLKKTGAVRILVGVVDHRKIPVRTKLTTKKLMIYYIYFQVEKVVEEGWLRPEDEYIQNFDDMEDTISQEFEERDCKRRKNDETKTQEVPTIQASEGTKKALEEREEGVRQQTMMDEDLINEGRNIEKDLEEAAPKTDTMTEAPAGETEIQLKNKEREGVEIIQLQTPVTRWLLILCKAK